MKTLLISAFLVPFLLAICFNNAFAETKEKMAVQNAVSEEPSTIPKIQLAADDAQKCRSDCLQQMGLCKQSADSLSKDDNERRKGEEQCDLNYRACVSSCR